MEGIVGVKLLPVVVDVVGTAVRRPLECGAWRRGQIGYHEGIGLRDYHRLALRQKRLHNPVDPGLTGTQGPRFHVNLPG